VKPAVLDESMHVPHFLGMPRTSFDLLLRTLRLPMGSEIIMSGITIKDMVKIAQYHGAAPVAVDLDFDTLAVNPATLEAAITPRTKVIVIAHVFGVCNDITPVCALARKLGIVGGEDCAECFAGPPPAAAAQGASDMHEGYTGHPEADLALFSFGTIKTSTAFGACVASVREGPLLEAMQAVHAGYASRPRSVLAGRLARYGAMHGLSTPVVYGALVRTVQGVGLSWDELVTGAIRGFPGDELIPLIRYAPSTPLLAMLQRRLSNFDGAYLQQRVQAGWRAVAELEALPPGYAFVPGTTAHRHAFWLFPVMVPDPQGVCTGMLRAGFDVTQGTSQLGPVSRYIAPQNDTAHFRRFFPTTSAAIMSGLVYLPVVAETSPTQMAQLMAALRRVIGERVAAGAPLLTPLGGLAKL
jgi:dTDP-4-amino-4,6-dideoxygalactose transaminase